MLIRIYLRGKVHFFRLIFYALFVFIFSPLVFAQTIDTTSIFYSEGLTERAIRKHLEVLVSDSLTGREATTEGYGLAANYVAGIFGSLGMPTMANGTYFQEVPLVRSGNTRMYISTRRRKYAGSLDFYSFGAFGEVDLSDQQIVFAGYGISDSLWDDYDRVNCEGKVVMIMEGEPMKDGERILATSYTGSSGLKKKIENAKVHGVAAVLIIVDDFISGANKAKKVRTDNDLLYLKNERDVPFFYISEDMADELMKGSAKRTGKIRKRILRKGKPNTFAMNTDIHVSSSDKKANESCKNVLGYIKGSSKPEEVIVVSAHMDHLGLHDGETYYGADDNASGTAVVISLAELFAKASSEGHQPERSILFLLFTAEEKGLLGSKYYVQDPVFPLENTKAILNIDMVGRTDTVHDIGSRYVYVIGSDKISSTLHNISESTNTACCNLELDYVYNDESHPLKLYRRSDHYNFVRQGVPAIFYFSGLHADYHKPTDTIDKIEYGILTERAKLIFHTLWNVVNHEGDIKRDAPGN
jgi:hypothetical protein